MPNTTFWIIAVAAFNLIYIALDPVFIKMMKITAQHITYDAATTTLDRLSTWTTWITGLQTAAMASIGFLLHEFRPVSEEVKKYTFYSLLFFGTSIIIAAWLLSSLPSIQQQLVPTPEGSEGNQKNDVYMAPLYSFVRLRFGRFSGLVHTFFLFGIISFALLVFAMLNQAGISAK